LGIAAWERGPGGAREVALVGSFGAAAAAGRVLFAAIPNVQPVTAMTACAGIALGPRAGAAVVGLATFGPSWTWQAFWALEGRGLAFDIAHATGNAVLAAVAGPALIRLLDRYGIRLRVELEPELEASPSASGAGRYAAAP